MVVLGPLAFTELRLVFDAPADRRRAGTFDLALPAGGALTRFAILQELGWQEAERVGVTHDKGSCEDRMARRSLNLPLVTDETPHRPSHFVAQVAPIPSRSAYRTAAALLDHDAPATALDMLRDACQVQDARTPASRRQLGMALARAGKLDEAVSELVDAVRTFEGARPDAFEVAVGAVDVLRQDLGIFASAAARAHPDKKGAIEERIRPIGVRLATRPSLRLLLSCEANAASTCKSTRRTAPGTPAPRSIETRSPERAWFSPTSRRSAPKPT